MARTLDTGLVRTFVAVAEAASMTAAANALHLSQGAVSQQVKRLEEALGCVLFQRGRRGLHMTPSGERLFGRAKQLLELQDEILSEMAADAVAGRVRLGAPYDLVGTCLAPVLRAYADAFPRAELSLVCASSPELAQALEMGRVDLAVVEEPAGSPAGECLGVERLVWVGSKGGTAHLKRPLPVSLVADTCAFRPAVLEALRECGVAWRTVFEGGFEATTAMVRVDLAVSAWLASAVPSGMDILPASAGLPALPNYAVTLLLPHHADAVARELARCLRDGLAPQRRAA